MATFKNSSPRNAIVWQGWACYDSCITIYTAYACLDELPQLGGNCPTCCRPFFGCSLFCGSGWRWGNRREMTWDEAERWEAQQSSSVKFAFIDPKHFKTSTDKDVELRHFNTLSVTIWQGENVESFRLSTRPKGEASSTDCFSADFTRLESTAARGEVRMHQLLEWSIQQKVEIYQQVFHNLPNQFWLNPLTTSKHNVYSCCLILCFSTSRWNWGVPHITNWKTPITSNHVAES